MFGNMCGGSSLPQEPLDYSPKGAVKVHILCTVNSNVVDKFKEEINKLRRTSGVGISFLDSSILYQYIIDGPREYLPWPLSWSWRRSLCLDGDLGVSGSTRCRYSKTTCSCFYQGFQFYDCGISIWINFFFRPWKIWRLLWTSSCSPKHFKRTLYQKQKTLSKIWFDLLKPKS